MAAAYRIYTSSSRDVTACTYYRQLLPITQMERMGLPVAGIIDTHEPTISEQARMAAFLESDFSLLYQATGELPIRLIEEGKKLKPMKDSDGEMRWPPTFILDSDDDIFNVMPLNVTYGALGTRRWDGTPMEDGDEIGIAHPLEVAPPNVQTILNEQVPMPLVGAKATFKEVRYVYDADGKWHGYYSLWKDGVNIDIAKNRAKLDNWRKILKLANLVTCSTPRTAEALQREVGDLPTFVTPNAIDFDEYPEIELRDHPSEVRILWEGAASHHESLWPLNKSLVKLSKKYPHATWHFFGAPYKWAAKNMNNVKFIPWVDYAAYKLRLSTFNHDISMAPLATNLFNKSRSAIRWYEASALWRPAATLAQKWAAYEDEVEDGKTAMLFSNNEEFEEKMSALIESETLRKEIASNAKDWVKAHRDSKKIALRLFHKWCEVREGHKLTMPLPDERLVEEQSVALSPQ